MCWLVAVSALTFVVTLALVPVLLVRMPADYFTRLEPPPSSWRGRHPALRMTGAILKNLLGLVLVVAGLVMLFVPGQGIAAILVGLSLLNFPGKRAFERRIIAYRPVLRVINAIRARARRPPLEAPDGLRGSPRVPAPSPASRR